MKTILLARVSSKEQEEGQSIPAQVRRLREYAEKKDVIPDPNQRHLIKKIFELYSTGNCSVRQIALEMEKLGLRNRQGNPVNLSKIDDVLKDTFYYGVMNTKDGPYPHHHEPLISRELFERVQQVRLSRRQKPYSKAIAFIRICNLEY